MILVAISPRFAARSFLKGASGKGASLNASKLDSALLNLFDDNSYLVALVLLLVVVDVLEIEERERSMHGLLLNFWPLLTFIVVVLLDLRMDGANARDFEAILYIVEKSTVLS